MKSPIVRLVLHNAFILSVIYLVTGIAVEAAWRFDLFRGNLQAEHWVYRLSIGLDALPTQVLHLLGLLGPLQQAYADGQVRELGLRWIYAVTTLLVILVTAGMVGVLMALTRRCWDRRARRTA